MLKALIMTKFPGVKQTRISWLLKDKVILIIIIIMAEPGWTRFSESSNNFYQYWIASNCYNNKTRYIENEELQGGGAISCLTED